MNKLQKTPGLRAMDRDKLGPANFPDGRIRYPQDRPRAVAASEHRSMPRTDRNAYPSNATESVEDCLENSQGHGPSSESLTVSPLVARYMHALATISHDLQSPITRMKLRVELAAESFEKEKMVRDLEEVEALVSQGLAYARNAHGSLEGISHIDVVALMESIVYDFQDTGRAVSISRKADAVLMTRGGYVRRIITNFIENSVKYGGAAIVEVEKNRGQAVTIRVQDRGPGIPESQLSKVWEPFFRLPVHDGGSSPGTGLGLAIAYELSKCIGGEVLLRNRVGGGLSAELRLGSLPEQMSTLKAARQAPSTSAMP